MSDSYYQVPEIIGRGRYVFESTISVYLSADVVNNTTIRIHVLYTYASRAERALVCVYIYIYIRYIYIYIVVVIVGEIVEARDYHYSYLYYDFGSARHARRRYATGRGGGREALRRRAKIAVRFEIG